MADEIYVKRGVAKAIAKDLGCDRRVVYAALSGADNSPMRRRIRACAIENYNGVLPGSQRTIIIKEKQVMKWNEEECRKLASKGAYVIVLDGFTENKESILKLQKRPCSRT